MKTWYKILILFFLTGNLSGSRAAQAPKDRPWRVRQIVTTGNAAFKKIEISNLMDLRPVFFKKQPRFSNSRLRSDVAAISRFYHNNGFLSVVVAGEIAGRDSVRKKVDLRISITEGNRTTVTDIVFLPHHPDSGVMGGLRCKAGRPLVFSNISADERYLRDTRANKGFLNATTTARMLIDTAAAAATVTFVNTDGPKVVVDTIRIDGAGHLKKRVVTRELSFHKEDTLTLAALRTSERRLYQTDLFSSVYIEPFTDSASVANDTAAAVKVPVTIALREADFFRLKFGVGYGTGEGLRGSVESSYYNLFKLGHRLTFKGNLSPKIQQTQAAYTTPWLLGIPLRFDVSLYYNRFNDTSTYQGGFWGSVVSLERPFGNDLTCQFWTKFEDVLWIKVTDLPGEFPVKNTQSFGVDLTFDTRNDLADPSTGAYSLLKCEAAGLAGINSNQFLKVTADNRLYWRINQITCASGIRFGWVRPYGQSPVVPIQDQFFAGGSRSVRGFKNNFLLTFTDSTDTSSRAKSGTLMLTANLFEVRFPIIWWIQGAVFTDAGILQDTFTRDPIQSALRGVRWTAGPGLRINTPIAIIRFDLGFKLNRKADESLTQWYLDVGQSF